MGINATYIQGYASSIQGIINGILVPVLISIAFIVFLWGIYNYFIAGANDEKKRTEGKTFAMYGIIGFVVLFSVWGIVNIFIGTLGLTASNVPSFPLIGGSTGSYSSIPSGTTGSPSSFSGAPLSSGTAGLTAAQAQAYTNMVQAQSAYNAACTQYGTNSTQCQQASMNYQNAINAFSDTGGSTKKASSGGATLGGKCTTDESCSGNMICGDDDVCVKPESEGGTCSGDGWCAGNLVCTNSVCTPPDGNTSNGTGNGTGGLGTSCSRSSDCSSGYCNSDNQSCEVSPSASTGNGTGTLGSYCTRSSDCSSGYCEPDSMYCADRPDASGSGDNQSNYEAPPDNYNPDTTTDYNSSSDVGF